MFSALSCKEYKLEASTFVYHEQHGVLTVSQLVKKIPGVLGVWGYKKFPENSCPRTLEAKVRDTWPWTRLVWLSYEHVS